MIGFHADRCIELLYEVDRSMIWDRLGLIVLRSLLLKASDAARSILR